MAESQPPVAPFYLVVRVKFMSSARARECANSCVGARFAGMQAAKSVRAFVRACVLQHIAMHIVLVLLYCSGMQTRPTAPNLFGNSIQ